MLLLKTKKMEAICNKRENVALASIMRINAKVCKKYVDAR